MWCIPQVGADFVACMEDILDLYAEPYDPKRPLVCFDEMPKQLIAETRQAWPTQPGQVRRYDYEYERRGVRKVWMFFEPLAGQRRVRITRQRTKQDWAQAMQWLADVLYPDAACIRVVLDNLNTHTIAALYETFEPAEANRLRRRFEFHYTPKHGSWLNMAEIELSVFERLAWAGPIPDEETLRHNTRLREAERNAQQATVNWQFTSQTARVKLRRLYPSISD
jgi:hypothetical protein